MDLVAISDTLCSIFTKIKAATHVANWFIGACTHFATELCMSGADERTERLHGWVS